MVLDEADKMLSLGFEPQLSRLRRRLCPPQLRAPPSYQRPQVVPAGVEPLIFASAAQSATQAYKMQLSIRLLFEDRKA